MNLLNKAVGVAGVTVSLAACGYGGDGHAITTAEIVNLLQLGASADYQLSSPEVVSRVEAPRLMVQSKERAGSSVQVRIGCVNGRECLPFYVGLRFNSVERAREFAGRALVGPPAAAKKNPVLIRQGAVARLEVVMGKGRLYLSVRCLQSGGEGDLIRARDEVTQKTYRARVIEKGQLRSEL